MSGRKCMPPSARHARRTRPMVNSRIGKHLRVLWPMFAFAVVQETPESVVIVPPPAPRHLRTHLFHFGIDRHIFSE